MNSMEGKVALVTGAGRGIGRAEALFFAAEGAKVVVNDPGVAIDGSGGDPGVAAQVVDEIVAAGGEAIANTDSVSDWAGAGRMVDMAIEAFGDLHILVNNATIHRIRGLVAMTEAEFDDVVAVKLKGTFAVTRWAARYWRDQYEQGARSDRAVINTASGSGLLNPLPGNSNYASANAGIGAMTIVHALELAKYGVRVNCLSPSMVHTRLTETVPGIGTPQSDPMRQAVVAACLATSRMTGQVFSVRGTSVAVNHGWRSGGRIDTPDDVWTVETLSKALNDIPVEDQFDKLASALGGAVGADGRAQLMRAIDAMT
jgi:NAD(P)-dependent dehydrogenase (short-subunit alcohol dehydrogenase family)